MKLLLIRHGETVHNVAGLNAGVTDSALTNHGVVQARRLAAHLAKNHHLTHVFTSDLQRAQITASYIAEAATAAKKKTINAPRHSVKSKMPIREVDGELTPDVMSLSTTDSALIQPNILALLREQDFGSYELTRSSEMRTGPAAVRPPAEIVPIESREAMDGRANEFLTMHLLPVLLSEDNTCDSVVAVVSHGLLLSRLWKCLLKLFDPGCVKVSHGLELDGRPLEHLGAWSNTGYLHLKLQNRHDALDNDQHMLSGWTMVIRAVNSKEHLQGLKRARGGLGSTKHDNAQKRIETFFKRRKE